MLLRHNTNDRHNEGDIPVKSGTVVMYGNENGFSCPPDAAWAGLQLCTDGKEMESAKSELRNQSRSFAQSMKCSAIHTVLTKNSYKKELELPVDTEVSITCSVIAHSTHEALLHHTHLPTGR